MIRANPFTGCPQLSSRSACRHSGDAPIHLWFCLPLVLCFIVAVGTSVVQAQAQGTIETEPENARAIVIGFVGGFVHSDDRRHSEVQLIHQLQASYDENVKARVFENRQREQAHKFILDSIAAPDHKLSPQEKARTHIILFGHSWGASSVVYLARELQRDGVPVFLTVQVDSIRKHGEDDSNIPSNVKQAVNFYQNSGILHGRSEITAHDKSKTIILGNYRYHYAKEPAACSHYPWYNRLLFKGHTAIECDPQVWSRIADLIQMQLPQSEVRMAAAR